MQQYAQKFVVFIEIIDSRLFLMGFLEVSGNYDYSVFSFHQSLSWYHQ